MRLLLALFFLSAHTLAAQTFPLWPDKPPQFLEGAPAEITEPRGVIRNVTVPAITIFPAPEEKCTGTAIIVCAGARYDGQGAHGVGNLIPQRVKHGFPPARWPQLLLAWLSSLPSSPRS